MANTTNDSHDIDIWFPDWLHVDWDDTNTCAYVTKLVNDFNFGLKSKFFYTIHEEENLVRLQNSRTPIFDLNIRELPLSKKETGNTLETRGLTYSYTFRTKSKRSTYGRFASAKNAHLECKGTKLFPHNQRARLLFALLYINVA